MHDVADAGQQFAAEAAAGVVAGEVHRFEVQRGDQCDGECIAHGHGGEGRGGRCQVVRADLAFDGDVQPDVGVFGQGRLAVAGHGDDFVAEGLEARDQLDDFFGFAAVGNQDQYVDRLEHAEVAVEGFGRMQEQARGAGGGEGGDHLLANQPGFTHAADRRAALAAEDEFYGALELAIETFCELADGLRLGAECIFGDWKVIHGEAIVP